MKYEFAIKKNLLNSGEYLLTPVFRIKSTRFSPFKNKWERIVKIYDDFILMDLDTPPILTQQECEDHIMGYKNKLEIDSKNKVKTEEIQIVEVVQ